MNIYMDNYGYMRRRKTGAIYDWEVNAAWKALLAYMKAYENDGYEVRAVYWFDN